MTIEITKSYKVPEGNFCVYKGNWTIACPHLLIDGMCAVFDVYLPSKPYTFTYEKCAECKEACKEARKQCLIPLTSKPLLKPIYKE